MDSSGPHPGLAVQRACDACRTRKIRCDRASPCSQCLAANLPCHSTTQRLKAPKDRVQVSKHYESKIDSIDHRLANIERLLRHSNAVQSSLQAHVTPVSSRVASPPLDHVDAATPALPEDDSSYQTPVTGSIGARAESIAATSVLEQTVGRDATIQHDAELMSALKALRSVVDHHQLGASGPTKGVASMHEASSAAHIAHPEWVQVDSLLRWTEGVKPMMFDLMPSAMLVNLYEKSRLIFEKRREGSPIDKLLVYSGLANICAESSSEGDVSSSSHSHNLFQTFSGLLLKTLATLPLFLPASVETVEALLIAILSLIGMCKPSLAWSLTCKAVQVCQQLGYNRLSRSDPESDPDFHRKVMDFWSIYTMDRNISFRLGHAPCMQDYDIDTPKMSENGQSSSVAVEIQTFWTDCGRVQGNICTQLYGPMANSLAPEDRVRIAESLADELEQIYLRKHAPSSVMILASRQSLSQYQNVPWVYSDDILHFSTLTTALYAIPFPHPGRFRAIEAARQCLRLCRDLSHRELHNLYNWTFCCHWVLLHAPLTTFTVVFYNVIANPSESQGDVQLLNDFVASLEPVRRLSDPIEKFYRLCSAFVNVAHTYVRAKARAQPVKDTSMRSQNPLPTVQQAGGLYGQDNVGFGQQSNFRTDEEAGGTNNMLLNDASSRDSEQQHFSDVTQSLQEWYSGNASLYGLLEQDISDPSFDFFNT